MHDRRELPGLKTSINRIVGDFRRYPSGAGALPKPRFRIKHKLPVKVTITHIEGLLHLFYFISHCTFGLKNKSAVILFSS